MSPERAGKGWRPYKLSFLPVPPVSELINYIYPSQHQALKLVPLRAMLTLMTIFNLKLTLTIYYLELTKACTWNNNYLSSYDRSSFLRFYPLPQVWFHCNKTFLLMLLGDACLHSLVLLPFAASLCVLFWCMVSVCRPFWGLAHWRKKILGYPGLGILLIYVNLRIKCIINIREVWWPDQRMQCLKEGNKKA